MLGTTNLNCLFFIFLLAITTSISSATEYSQDSTTYRNAKQSESPPIILLASMSGDNPIETKPVPPVVIQQEKIFAEYQQRQIEIEEEEDYLSGMYY